MKTILILVVVVLAIRFFNQFVSWLKRKGVMEYKNEQAWRGFDRHFLMNPKIRKALEREKFYRAREFFLMNGVLRKRSSSGTDEDDR